jgi:hypothetical protein
MQDYILEIKRTQSDHGNTEIPNTAEKTLSSIQNLPEVE